MNNVVTFKTAQRLKEAGFPQPAPEAGQFWYNPDFGIFVVGRRSFVDGTTRSIFYFETGNVLEVSEVAFLDCVFAPAVPDILREITHSFAYIEMKKFAVLAYLEMKKHEIANT